MTGADLLTVEEAAALLRVERKTIYAAVARGEIPALRIGSRILRFEREAVLASLRAKSAPA